MVNTQLKFEGKIPTVQKLLPSQGITQNQVPRPILPSRSRSCIFKPVCDIEMLCKQFKLEGNIQKGSMFSNLNKNFGCLKLNLTLKIKVKVTNFKNPMIH